MLSACGSLSRSRQKVWVNAVRTQVIATKWEDDSEENNIFGHPKVVSERFVETAAWRQLSNRYSAVGS